MSMDSFQPPLQEAGSAMQTMSNISLLAQLVHDIRKPAALNAKQPAATGSL
jgi:hypothetical protein